VAQYAADISTLDGAAITVVASGFLNPANNSNGPAFGLFVATAAGGELLELPAEAIEVARVQVIHNSADLAADTVDVYLNDGLLLDDFAFRNASPFVDAPIGAAFDITVAPKTSADSSDGIWRKSYTLEGGKTYVLIANGIVSASGYDPVQAFDIYVSAMGREVAGTSGNTDVLIFHGSTDAPTVDIHEATAGELIDNLAYGEFDADYLELPTADYVIEVRDETGETVVASYQAPLATLELEGYALVAVASGFLTPANNSDGPAFGIWVAPAAGGEMVALPLYTSTRDIEIGNSLGLELYPNPVSSYLNISYSIEEPADISVEIFAVTGQKMLRRELGRRNAGDHTETMNMSSFENGIYILKMNNGSSVQTSRIKVVK
jgi:hypothetical protein